MFSRYSLWALLACLWACQSHETQKKQAGKEKTAPFRLEYAKKFGARFFDTHKEIWVALPTQDTVRYALVPRGKQAPTGFAPDKIIETPVQNCVMASHTHIACLKALGLVGKLKGLTEAAYLPDSVLLGKLASGALKEVGKGGIWQNELLIAMKPDILMLSNEGNERLTLPASCRKVVNMDWQETHPLGRAEWLLFVAMFFEEEGKAIAIVNNIKTKYAATRDSVAKLNLPPQKVIFDVPYKGVWYMPAGGSYVAQFLKDARGAYAWQKDKGTASLSLDFEAVYAEARQASFWLNLGACRKRSDVTDRDARLADVPALKAGKAFSYHKRAWANGANPYFYEGILQPHYILRDLVEILHNSAKGNLYYYQKLD